MVRVSKQHVKYLRNVETGEQILKPYYLDYITAKKALLEDYYQSYELIDLVNGRPEFNRYGVSGFYSSESFYSGGLREDLYSRFVRFEMAKKFEISVDDWFNVPYSEAMKKLDIAKLIWEAEFAKKEELLKKNEADLKNT